MTEPNILSTLAAQADTVIGTYVGAGVSPFTAAHRELFQVIKGLSGLKIGAAKLHSTIIFSRGAVVEAELIQPILDTYKLPLKARISGAAAFDALPGTNLERDAEVATLVIKLDSPELMQLHAACRDLGCTHTFPELSPHVSLFYGVPKQECHEAADRLTAYIEKLPEPLYVELYKLYTEPLKQNWAADNTSKR